MRQRLQALPFALSPALLSTGLLFAIDMLTNVTDYGFHVYLGRVLDAGSFALVQTVNAVVLVVVAVGSVLQPVVARYVAAESAEKARTIFQRYTQQSVLIALTLALIGWLARAPIGQLLNLPIPAVLFLLGMVVVALLRPIMAGMLQGQQQVVAFGLVRTAFAFGRFALAILLMTLFGRTALAGIAAYPLGGLVSLIAAAYFIGRSAWQTGVPIDPKTISDGWRVASAAFLAYAAFMFLQTVDIIWVNRTFAPDVAGTYASAVVLRRVLAVFPGAVVVILYPRIVALVKLKQLPDKLIGQAIGLIGGSTAILTFFYFVAGEWIVGLMFGRNYTDAAPLLGWMGVAMLGYGIGTIWLNVFLATRPRWFVVCLGATVIVQISWLALGNTTIETVLTAFGVAGWLIAMGGGLIYWLNLRPELNC